MTKKEIAPLYVDHLSQHCFEEAFGLLAPDATMWVSSSQQTAQSIYLTY